MMDFTLQMLSKWLRDENYPSVMILPFDLFQKLVYISTAGNMMHRVGRDDESEFVVVGRTKIRPSAPPVQVDVVDMCSFAQLNDIVA